MGDQIITDILCNVKNRMKEYFFLKEETYDKNAIDAKEDTLNGKIDSKSTVKFTKNLNSGTKIGDLTINDKTTSLYCNNDTNTTYTPASAIPLADATSGKVGTSAKYAREDHVHPTEKSKVTFSPTLTSGVEIGTININGTDKKLYCEKNPDTYNANAIIDSNAHTNINSSKNERQDNINTKIDTALGKKAPTSHAIDDATYGKGTADVFGHVKIANNLTTTSTDSIALAAAQGRALKESISNINGSNIKLDNSSSTTVTSAISNHNHGSLLNQGIITATSDTVNKIAITDNNNNLKVINKLPADKVIHQDISGKVDKVQGKNLSTNDLTDGRAYKLDSVFEGARAKKRPLGFLIESDIDDTNQSLIQIKQNTKLKVRLYESENGNIINDKSNIIYPRTLQIHYTILNPTTGSSTPNRSLETSDSIANFNVGLNPGNYIVCFDFYGNDNFYPVYRTIILQVIENN